MQKHVAAFPARNQACSTTQELADLFEDPLAGHAPPPNSVGDAGAGMLSFVCFAFDFFACEIAAEDGVDNAVADSDNADNVAADADPNVAGMLSLMCALHLDCFACEIAGEDGVNNAVADPDNADNVADNADADPNVAGMLSFVCFAFGLKNAGCELPFVITIMQQSQRSLGRHGSGGRHGDQKCQNCSMSPLGYVCIFMCCSFPPPPTVNEF